MARKAMMIKEDHKNKNYVIIESAYTMSGAYIGGRSEAEEICDKRGIEPEPISDMYNVCTIGYCKKEMKWYGWSHRGIKGFRPGSKVKFGDIGFTPRNKKQFRDLLIHEYRYDAKLNGYEILKITAAPTPDGIRVRRVIQGDDGKIYKTRVHDYPIWGEGEWVAKSNEDARQMAINFAKSVS